MRFETRLAKLETIQRAQLDAAWNIAFNEWSSLISDKELAEMCAQECADLKSLSDDELHTLKTETRRRESIGEKCDALRELREEIAQRLRASQGNATKCNL